MSNKKIQIKTFIDKFLVPNKIFIALFFILNSIIIYNTYLTQDRINKYFRIHVVANSDSINDQILKYELADAVDKYIASLIDNTNVTKNEVKNIIENNISDILTYSNNFIQEKGYNYNIYANIGNIYYDKKEKDELYMDNGIYDSLQIVIEKGKGQNWWSLLYPYAYDSYVEKNTEKKDDTNSITTNELISSKNITYKFGIFEFITNLFN